MSASPSRPGPAPRLLRRAGWAGLLAAAAGLAALAAGCSPPPPARANKPAEVVVTTPITDEVLDYQDFTGRLDAFFTVDLRARVTGYVLKAPFTEGQHVREGDVLFYIDPKSYKADFDQSEANLNLAIADRRLQEANAVRAATMLRSRSIGREEYDQILAAREKSRAAVRAAEAARYRASVFLDYTEVKAPMNGRISRRYVDPGNLVKNDDTLLTTIVSDDTLYAYFDVDERTYLDLQAAKLALSPGAGLSDITLPVLMRLANEDEFTHAGQINFVDNRLNGNTGTIRMRGLFKNVHGLLKSGLFVRIRLPLNEPYPALLIPDEAVQSDQGRKYVWVVNADNKVEYRKVELGQAVQKLRVIKDGLKMGERVIVSGQQRVRAEVEVTATEQPPPKPPDFPLRKLLGHKPAKAGPRRKPTAQRPDAPAERRQAVPVSQNADSKERPGK